MIVNVTGSVSSFLDVGSSIAINSAYRITGKTSCTFDTSYKLNISKSSAINPKLVTQNTPYEAGDCPIAAIEYEGFSPNKIVNVISRENDYYENSQDFHRLEVLTRSGNLYPIIHYPYSDSWNHKLNYLVTDFRSNNSNGSPLFFQYEPLFDVYAPSSGVAIRNIYKNDSTVINPDNYIVQYSYDLLVSGNNRYSSTSWRNQDKTKNIHRTRLLLPYNFITENQFYTIEYNKSNQQTNQYQKELIELTSLYNTSDYSISSSGLSLSPSGRITGSGNLILVKDPRHRVAPLDIVAIKDENDYLSDQIATWRLRMNVGSFMRSSGFFTATSGNFYALEDNYFDGTHIPVTNVKPELVRPDMLRLKESPIYVDTSKYTYPLYRIDVYDKTNSALTDEEGKIAIDINGQTRTDIRIKSIDRDKGYIHLDRDLDPADDIEVSFFLSPSGNFIIDNLEMNPKVSSSGVDFHISGYPDGFGIAVRPYTDDISGWYPYIYDLSEPKATRTVSNLYRKDSPGDAVVDNWTDDDFITIGEIDLNRLSSDIIRLTDARKVGGGAVINNRLRDWFKVNHSGIKEHEKDWYSDYAYYGGVPLSNSSIVIIHIPQESIDIELDKWTNYYESNISDVDEAREKAYSEFKHYLDQTIRKHLSAGTDYVILPTISGQFSNKILDLRQ